MNPNPAPVAKQRSPLFYVAMGCGLMVLLMVVVVGVTCGGCLYEANKLGKGVMDPTQRDENVRKMLGKAPEGYYPIVTLPMPLVMDLAVLGDAPLIPDAGPPNFKRLFQYWRIIDNENSRQMKDYFDGKDVSADVFRRNSVNVEVTDVIGKGVVKTGDGAKVRYVASRGRMASDFERGGGAVHFNTLMNIECPDTSVRVVVWSEKDPAPDKPAGEVDPKGTVLDESAISALMVQITPCPK